ncbi:Ribonuclease H-like superfamily [Sesbania bispinosa]|nr:Ribonuclease H-like superfamily [Sesbania bispinosa]
MSCSQTQEQNDDTKPLWNCVTKIKNVGGGGNFEIQCMLCDLSFNGSYTRARAHLLKITGKGVRGCKSLTPQRLVEFKKMDNEAALRIDKSKAKFVSLPLVGETNIGVDPKKRKTSSALENAFNMQARETLDFKISRMFYSTGLPFHLARNPYFRRAFSYAANNSIGGYQPPVMLKRFRQLKQGLREMVISDQWSSYKEDDIGNVTFVKETLLDDVWWDKVDYILAFTSPIYDVLRKTDTEALCLHLVYEMWDSMIKESSTPLHCLAHSLNPRYFVDVEVRTQVNVEFANFTDGREGFDDIDSLSDRGKMDAKSRWLVHGAHAPILQKVALKLLGQPCSSSCCEKNWSTYSFIHSIRRNKMAPHRAEDLVFVHSNLHLLSRNSLQCHQEETKLWDIAGDEFDSLDEFGILEVADLSLDEPELEVMFFNDDQE